MGGGNIRTGELFSYVDLEDRFLRNRPLRAIRLIVNEAVMAFCGELSAFYSPLALPSMPPERLHSRKLRSFFETAFQ